MNNSWAGDIGSKSDAFCPNQTVKQLKVSVNRMNEPSKSAEVTLVSQNRKEMLRQSVGGGGISVDMQSNWRLTKKNERIKSRQRVSRTNESIVLKPRNIFFPRLNTLGSLSEDKQEIIERSKSSKRSMNLRRILSYGHCLRGERKKLLKSDKIKSSHEQNKLDKMRLENIFLAASPKNKASQPVNEQKNQQDLMKLIKIKKLQSHMFVEHSSKYFFLSSQKQAKQ